MISLSEFIEINHEIILFIYGLGFFVLGFSIILQVRRSSRLELARSLRWLAAFGILHAFHEWGELFIPIQAVYLDEDFIRLLYSAHLFILASSFVCLFGFGVVLLRPTGQARWLRFTPVIVLAGWALASFSVLYPKTTDFQLWRNTAATLARYAIGFPGGMLAAYSLRKHTQQRIKPLNAPQIERMLQAAGLSLSIYAVLSGLIPPPVNFFPGNWVNSITFTQAIGFPPWIFRSLISLVIALTIIRALEIFDIEAERRIEELEQRQIIAAEHERLARELHDGAIQKVYTAGLLVESASRLAEPESEMDTRLGKAVAVLGDAVADLRRNLAELHASTSHPAEPLPSLLERIAADPRYNSMVKIKLTSNLETSSKLTPGRTGHITAIVNEALSNAVRHSQAQNVKITAEDTGERLKIMIQDDGIGLADNAAAGYGLRNMRDRARLLNGSIEFGAHKGTTITLEIPWTD
ncbi:MAG: ATP-binding protein [Chloroflexota bacterium]